MTAMDPSRIRIFDVQRLVARQAGIRIAELLRESREQPLARVRQEAYWLARKLTGRSYPYLGAAFGGRDHTTVRHGVLQIERLRRTDPDVRDRLYRLELQLKETVHASAAPVS
ncbi:helix-turn-helix domain-containing protein [Oceanibaculum indicum]|uniref:Chromosomal replication initiation protein n=1 Tax=Oceanibaculum indicum P24 TaxID=1207063 RepID=K2J5V0_9PROT|nr:helix-turn-helix domain-containing protein [Oceanibaculum indicum]EKE78461.1 chromosomal replication initiation protein [Oceanibaculum indicum P24]